MSGFAVDGVLSARRARVSGSTVTASRMKKRTIAGGERLPPDLTRRERQIVDLLLKGCSNKEIASRLRVSERTIKNQLSALYMKTKFAVGWNSPFWRYAAVLCEIGTFGLLHGCA
jgi:DNA-binding NarL/FixJ family response regulator